MVTGDLVSGSSSLGGVRKETEAGKDRKPRGMGASGSWERPSRFSWEPPEGRGLADPRVSAPQDSFLTPELWDLKVVCVTVHL